MHSAKPFLQSSELRLPLTLARRRLCPPPRSGGGAHSLAVEEGGGGSQFWRGDIHCGGVCTLLCDSGIRIIREPYSKFCWQIISDPELVFKVYLQCQERIAALEKQSKQKDIQLIQKDQEITQMRAKLFNEEKLIRYLDAGYLIFRAYRT